MTRTIFGLLSGRLFAAFFSGLIVIGLSPIARADVTVTFNGLTNSSGIQGAVQSTLAAGGYGGSVTVTGAMLGNGYTGDNHVVGPNIGGTITALTLGNSDGGVMHNLSGDNFIMNADGHSQITMSFLSQLIFGVGFDFAIFPNGDVPDGTKAGVTFPDFKFKASLGGVQVNPAFQVFGVMPGTNGTFLHSPNSGPNSPELAPQLLSNFPLMMFPGGVDKLEFIDWPVRIGIDNLQFVTGPPTQSLPTPIPEPSTLLTVCAVLSALGTSNFLRRRSSRA